MHAMHIATVHACMHIHTIDVRMYACKMYVCMCMYACICKDVRKVCMLHNYMHMYT